MSRLLASLFSNLSLMMIFGFIGLAGVMRIYASDLPSHDELRNYQPKMLSRVYSGEGKIVAEFARERRVFVPIDEVPDLVKQAFISAEDKNFYSHPGVDATGIMKAVFRFAEARAKGRSARLTGASTITQQVMKNFLVGDERSVERKIKEGILAVRVESAMSKDKILELYLNDIALGQRAHGIVAAAENYFDKTLEELEPEEAAYLAALPKGPANYHPIKFEARATARRNYVLREMAENGVISRDAYAMYRERPLETIVDERRPALIQRTKPTYFTSEVRRQLIREVGTKQLYHGGLTVRATIDGELQAIAEKALRRGLEKYDRGRGIYRGAVAIIPAIADNADGARDQWRTLLLETTLARDVTGWAPAVVLEVGDKSAIVGVEGTEEAAEGREPGEIRLRLSRERQWIRRTPARNGRPRRAGDIWTIGDVVYVRREEEGWSLRQIPGVQGAFMAMDPHSGRVFALQGGFSHDDSAFNRATQAQRQPGSSFKPFIYAAALDVGYTPKTKVKDEPIKIGNGRSAWRPKNSSGKTYGIVTLRKALELSLNLVTVRIAQAVGMDRVGEYAERFGVYEDMPETLSYSLGAGETTLWQMVAAYGMIANGGKRVVPTVIDRIQDRHGQTLFRHDPRYCQGCDSGQFGQNRTPILFDARSQIMDPFTAYNLTSMLQGVVSRGTASRTVGGLEFPVAGKTGTTNDSKDAWFVGYTRNMVAGCFIGYDTPTPMGRGAYGGTLCGPVFREFMKAAHELQPPGRFARPRDSGGTVTIKVHALTGERLPDDAEGQHVITEVYRLQAAPELLAEIDPDVIDDVKIFAAIGADLPFILPEGEDVPLAPSGGGSVGAGSRSNNRPSSVGLGTGGLY
ncbi:MAG: PBP1A family penicillin-binding protein [Pseudomonadota bacterium]